MEKVLPSRYPCHVIAAMLLAIRMNLVFLFLALLPVSSFAQLNLVKDINTERTGFSYSDDEYTRLTDVDGTLYFLIQDSQLWKSPSNGVTATFLKEFVLITNLTNINGTLFFTASDGEHGLELWKTDGTPAGTVMVKDIYPGEGASSPSELTNVNGVVYFSADDGSRGRELWKSDGTPTGTLLVKDILRVVGSSKPSNLEEMNGMLYFTANDGQKGYELWRTDGTSAGTIIVKDIRQQYKVSSSPEQLTNVNGQLFFTALVSRGKRTLWKSDGTRQGTLNVTDKLSNMSMFTNVNGQLFLAASDAAHGLELWKSDGTTAGTSLVKDFTPGPGSETGYATPHLSYFKSINNKLYLLAVSRVNDIYGHTQNLWVTDGTDAGTQRLTEYPDYVFSFINPYLTSYQNLVYFVATRDNANICRTEGTPEGEEIFIENVSEGYTSRAKLTVSGDFLYYVSDSQLWKTDGVNRYAINGVGTSTKDSDPLEITDANGIVYFDAFDGHHHGLWKSDGTPAGTILVRYFADRILYLTLSDGQLYYFADAIDSDSLTLGWKLWKTDLTSGSSTWVSDINPGNDDYITELTDVNGTLFFALQGLSDEGELWKTSGSLESTQRVRNFNNLANPPTELTNANGTLYFAAMTDNVGNELWKSDGTEAGTVMVKKINPNQEEPSDPNQLTAIGNMIFFVAYNGYDYEVWQSDGTSEGTAKVRDIRTNDQNDYDVNRLKAVNGMLYFAAIDSLDSNGNYTRAVWKTDGTDAGTVKIATLPGRYDTESISGLYIMDMVNGSLMLGLQDQTGHNELWKTDETTAGTEKLADLNNFQNTVDFSDYVVKDDILYFSGFVYTGPEFNAELWRTNGTTCGTFVVTDSGRPTDLILSNGEIFMASGSVSYGRELFVLDESAIYDPCSAITTESTVTQNAELEQVGNEEIVSSYPNPFTAEFVLNVRGEEGSSYKAKVVGMNGNDLLEGEFLFNQDYKLGYAWGPGVYFVKVQQANGMFVRKIVKTR